MKATQGTDTTGIIHNIECLLLDVNQAQQHAQAAIDAMEGFPDLDNERRRLEGILGVLGSLAYSAQASPLASALVPANSPIHPGTPT